MGLFNPDENSERALTAVVCCLHCPEADECVLRDHFLTLKRQFMQMRATLQGDMWSKDRRVV